MAASAQVKIIRSEEEVPFRHREVRQDSYQAYLIYFILYAQDCEFSKFRDYQHKGGRNHAVINHVEIICQL